VQALKQEGTGSILVNSIRDDHDRSGDGRCHLHRAITWQVLEHIIAKERPDAYCDHGRADGLNARWDLHQHGVLGAYRVQLIGALDRSDSPKPKTARCSRSR